MQTKSKNRLKQVYQHIVQKVTTLHGWIGNYEYGRLFTPRIPYLFHSKTTPPFLAHKEELPILAAAIVGFQHALAMMGGIVTVPLILSGSGSNNLNLDDSYRTYMVASALIASGILSIIQITGLKIRKTGYQLGTGLISVVGTSFTTLPVAQAAFSTIRKHGEYNCSLEGPCPEAFGAMLGTIMVCCWLEVAISFLPLTILRRVFPPLVTGSVVVLIGASLVASGFQDWAGGSGSCYNYSRAVSNLEALGVENISAILPSSLSICPSSQYAYQKYPFGDAKWIGLGSIVFLTIIVIEIFGSPFMRTAEIMIGFLLGLLVASVLNYTNIESVQGAPVITFLWTKTFPIRFYPPAIIPLLIVFVVLAIEAMGDVTASMEASQLPIIGKEANGRLQGGILADGLNAFLGALMTTFPYSTFAQNNGVIAMTRCANIWAGYWCCLFLIVFGIFSKISALFVAIPDAVLGGMTTFLFANVVTSGIRILCFVDWTRRSRFIVACTLSIGLGATLLPEWFSSVIPSVEQNSALQGLIQGIDIIMSTGFCIGAFIAVFLNLILPVDEDCQKEDMSRVGNQASLTESSVTIQGLITDEDIK
ncbi:nucleobase:cation symporter-2, NCS2 family [Galdieria sulphuraria]|uniref:Nucleobase:cation symporter-2, NCS2 family n=2 Tax=Galdieria sulphuraria TaxID=130081 RepID=M2XQP3_GALSU|nr:nucleobase:cation symporter-2, NCS2 family [Galdieria sulphuraria]EME25759.1 nucleobase:cation symporter-2, NCS2 family [Galdieria sulphuraria]|eukprot:XP_005702279.1 nucleobase:cation symporter-2, NCS2 family [Galdieria sulphuraria]